MSNTDAGTGSQPRSPTGGALAISNLALRFLLELAALGSLVFAALQLPTRLGVKIAVAIVVPLAAASVWASFVAPAASRRLPDPWRLLLELIIFASALGALALTGQPLWAAGLGLVVVANVVLMFAWDQRGTA